MIHWYEDRIEIALFVEWMYENDLWGESEEIRMANIVYFLSKPFKYNDEYLEMKRRQEKSWRPT